MSSQFFCIPRPGLVADECAGPGAREKRVVRCCHPLRPVRSPSQCRGREGVRHRRYVPCFRPALGTVSPAVLVPLLRLVLYLRGRVPSLPALSLLLVGTSCDHLPSPRFCFPGEGPHIMELCSSLKGPKGTHPGWEWEEGRSGMQVTPCKGVW